MKEILRRTWAEIDLDALARDFAAVRQAASKNAMVCCVIKADAYGHGAVRMAQEFEALGADWFAVSNLEEALQLRLGGISRPMLVLGYTPPRRPPPWRSTGFPSACTAWSTPRSSPTTRWRPGPRCTST